MMMRSVVVLMTMAITPGQASNTTCQCPMTSGNRKDCCSDGHGHGEGSGDFCGNWFQKTHCNGETPVCCNSGVKASCGPLGSSCSPGCKGLGGRCRVIPPSAPSPASKAYDVKQAKAIAFLANGAGCGPKDEFKTFNCKACREVGFDIVPGTIHFAKHNDLGTHNANFAYIARLHAVSGQTKDSDYGCVIGFAGSGKPVNYVEDFEFWHQKPTEMPNCPGCQVEAGFYHVWMRLEEQILAALMDLGCNSDGPNNKVLVTGHSLGAATSIVAMFSLKVKGFDVQQSVVFELPRVGNKAFAEAYAKMFKQDFPVFVVSHAIDIVPHLPPTDIPGLVYEHVNAPEVYYFPSYDISQYIICDGPDDPRCSARYSLKDALASAITNGTGADHCRPFFLAPNINPDGNVPDICYSPPEFCNGGASASAAIVV